MYVDTLEARSHSHGARLDVGARVTRAVEVEQWRHLLHATRDTGYGAVAGVVIGAAGVAGVVDTAHLMLWTAASLIVTLWRLAVCRRILSGELQDQALIDGGRRVGAFHQVQTVLWGAAAFWFFPLHSVEHQLIFPMIALGVAAAGGSNYAVRREVGQAYALAVMVPLMVRFATAGTQTHLLIALLMVIYTAVLVQLGQTGFDAGLARFQTQHALRTLAAREQEGAARLKALLDNLTEGVAGVDINGSITTANDAFRQVMGSRITRPGHPLPPQLHSAVTRCLGTGERVVTEFDLESGRLVSGVVSPIAAGDGTASGGVLLVRDVTLEREVDRMKTELTAVVAHELRTPLTSVVGFAKLVQSQLEKTLLPALPPGTKKLDRTAARVQTNMGIIVEEGNRLTALINDVLDVAKMESGHMEWRDEAVEPGTLVHRAVAATTSLFGDGPVALQADVAPGLSTLRGDPDRLLQVLINLISNAAKFTDAGQVTVRAQPHSRGVLFEVVDTGVGIPRDAQARVFDRFGQVKDAQRGRSRGTGLGLPICQEVLVHHGGDLQLRSEVGAGSTFWFVLAGDDRRDRPSPGVQR